MKFVEIVLNACLAEDSAGDRAATDVTDGQPVRTS
jgi:hypothetical protein